MKKFIKRKIFLDSTKKKLSNVIYILPNIFTTANSFCGFFAIIRAIEGYYIQAAYAIIIATIFDLLDGRIARLTKTTSEFGVQYDSLSDLISFCLAPSLILFTMNLKNYGRIGWLLSFLFFICGSLRLARFNVQTKKLIDKNFIGLPTPVAALMIATFIILTKDISNWFLPQIITNTIASSIFKKYFILITTPLLAILMVSPIKYCSFKDFDYKVIKPFNFIVLLIIFIFSILVAFEILGFFIILAYVLSGPILYTFSKNYRTPDLQIEAWENSFNLAQDYISEEKKNSNEEKQFNELLSNNEENI